MPIEPASPDLLYEFGVSGVCRPRFDGFLDLVRLAEDENLLLDPELVREHHRIPYRLALLEIETNMHFDGLVELRVMDFPHERACSRNLVLHGAVVFLEGAEVVLAVLHVRAPFLRPLNGRYRR